VCYQGLGVTIVGVRNIERASLENKEECVAIVVRYYGLRQ
jgi:hypothetical protein